MQHGSTLNCMGFAYNFFLVLSDTGFGLGLMRGAQKAPVSLVLGQWSKRNNLPGSAMLQLCVNTGMILYLANHSSIDRIQATHNHG